MPLLMANEDRLKRRLLHDLVQQNVDLIHGVVRRPPRPRRSPYPRLAGALALVLLSTALVGSTRLLSTLSAAPRPAAHAMLSAARPEPQGTPESSAGLPIAPSTAAGLLADESGAFLVAAAAGAGGLAGLPGEAPDAAGAPGSGAPARALRQALEPAPAIDPAVLPLAVRKIAIDAGHGGDSQGTRTPLGLLEKDITLDIARRLRQVLEDQLGFEVVMTRKDDATVSLAERAAVANRRGADIFVSVHVNWIDDHAARGVETYFLGPTNDPFLNRLAAAENRDSGYSMTDMRELLDRIYAGVRQDKSRQLAEMVQAALFRSLGKVNPKVGNRGVKSAPFIVLLSTRMPAILAEVSCLSNGEEARLLAKPLYRQYIAVALADGLRAYASAARGAAAGNGG